MKREMGGCEEKNGQLWIREKWTVVGKRKWTVVEKREIDSCGEERKGQFCEEKKNVQLREMCN